MERMGQVLAIKPGAIAEYKRLHRAVWPEVVAIISAARIHNYSIFLRTCSLSSRESRKCPFADGMQGAARSP